MEEPLRSTNYPDKYSLTQYFVDKPDPQPRPVLPSSDIEIVRSGTQDSWTKDQLPSISTG
jgi:hypothetical protein